MRRALAAALCALLLPLLAAAPAAAQEPEAAGEAGAKPQAEAEPEPIPLAGVVEAAEQAGRRLRAAEQAVEPEPAVTRLEERLPEVSASVDERVATTNRELEGTPGLEVLRELESGLELLRSDLDEARTEVTERAAELGEELDALRSQEATWAATREAARSGDAPDAVRERIEATLAETRALRERLEARRGEVLTLQSRVGAEEERVAEARARIRAARERIVGELLVQDARPLWRALGDRPGEEDVRQGLARELAGHGAALEAFWARRAGRVPLQLGLFAALLAWVWRGRGPARALAAEDPRLDAARQIFEQPVATALLLAILASLWLYPQAPRAVNGILGVIAVVPAVLLLRRLVTRPLLPAVYALAFLALVSSAEDLVAAVPLLARLVFEGKMAGMVLFLLWLLRPARLARVPSQTARDPFFRAVGLGARLVLVACAVGLLADVLGYARLGRLVGNAGLGSAYVALVFYAAVRVLEGLASFALRQRPLRLLRMVERHRERIWRGFARTARLAATGLWLLITLEMLALRQPLLEGIAAALGAELSVGNLAISLGDVLAFALTVVAAFALAAALRFVLEEDVFPRVRLGRGVPYAVATLSRYGLLLVGFVFAVAAAGVDLTRFTILAGAFGVGIGFGLQNVVNNFVSGLILLFERPVQVGDVMQTGELFGEVRSIGIRSSTVRTWEGAEVIVPNADLISAQVVNWTLSDRLRRIDVRVGVAYGTDPSRVLALLVEVARAKEEILEEPAPQAYFLGFGDSSLDFELRAWTGRFEVWISLRSELTVAVHDALRDAGIPIPFPQRDLHLRSVAPELRNGRPEGNGHGGGPGPA